MNNEVDIVEWIQDLSDEIKEADAAIKRILNRSFHLNERRMYLIDLMEKKRKKLDE